MVNPTTIVYFSADELRALLKDPEVQHLKMTLPCAISFGDKDMEIEIQAICNESESYITDQIRICPNSCKPRPRPQPNPIPPNP